MGAKAKNGTKTSDNPLEPWCHSEAATPVPSNYSTAEDTVSFEVKQHKIDLQLEVFVPNSDSGGWS